MGDVSKTIARGLIQAAGYASAGIAALGLILGVSAVAGQRRLVYPLGYWHAAEPAFLPVGWKAIRTPHDGRDTRSYVHVARDPNAPVLIAFHGNAADGFSMATTASPWTRAGWTVIVPEFPGYADAPGSPDEEGIIASAHGAWDWAIAHGARPSRIVVLGNSIGSGPAIALAAAERPALLMIVSGVADLGDVMRNQVPFVPDLLVWDHWRNELTMRKVKSPVIVWHGTTDTLVPHSHGVRLGQAAGTKVRDRKDGHGLYWSVPLQEEMLGLANAKLGFDGASVPPTRVRKAEGS